MRNPSLFHLLWLLIAIGAFALGKMQSGSPAAESNPRKSADHRTGSRTGEGSAPGSHDGSTRSLPNSGNRSSPSSEFAGRILSAGGMTTAMQSVMAETDPLVRQRRFTDLLASLTPENAEAAVRALHDAPRSRWNWGQELSLLTYAWGRIDGKAAAAYARTLEGRTREWTMAAALAGWSSDRPDQARAWLESLDDPEERRAFTRGLVHGLAQRDVDQATAYVAELSQAGDERAGEYMEAIARHQLSQGFEHAAQWTDNLPDGTLKGDALHTIANDYVHRNPEEAAAWVAQYAESDFSVRAISEVSEEWAENDPAKALQWVSSLPDGISRNHALGETVSEWADQDPAAAGRYLSDLPPGDERDFAVSAYSRRVVEEDPATALQWAQTIQSQRIRSNAVTRTAREWLQRDHAAATAWMQSANLPPADLEKITAPETDEHP